MKTNTILKVLLGAAALLLIPLVAMQFTSEVNWTGSDFLNAWVLLSVAGLGLSILIDKNNSTNKRVLGVVVLIAILYLWAELAVGIFTNWGS